MVSSINFVEAFSQYVSAETRHSPHLRRYSIATYILSWVAEERLSNFFFDAFNFSLKASDSLVQASMEFTSGPRREFISAPSLTRTDILGHEGGNITTHYSVAEIRELVEAVERIVEASSDATPSLTLIRIGGGAKASPTKLPQGIKKELVI